MANPYRTVLVGTDGSATADLAVARAAAVAAVSDAVLHVAFVGDEDEGRRVLDDVEQRHAGHAGFRRHVLAGDPADALLGLASAAEVDLVVVGNKGMAGAQRFLLGSVPNKVSHKASCDVLIVHTTS